MLRVLEIGVVCWVMLQAREWMQFSYSCPNCRTKTGDHADNCPFKEKT